MHSSCRFLKFQSLQKVNVGGGTINPITWELPKTTEQIYKNISNTQNIVISIFAIQLNLNTMITFDYSLIEVDKKLPERIHTESGLVLEIPKEGSEYERCPQEGTIDVVSFDAPYEKGQTVIFEHQVSDRETEYFGKQHYYAKDEEIIGFKEIHRKTDNVGNNKDDIIIKSFNRLVCEKILEDKAEKSDIIETLKKEEAAEQIFKVTFSPFKGYSEGDIILVRRNHDYPIDRIKKVFIEKDHVIKNITTGEVMNDMTIVEVEVLGNTFQLDSGIHVSNKYAPKGIGEVVEGKEESLVGNKVYFVGGFPFKHNKKSFKAILSDNILAVV